MESTRIVRTTIEELRKRIQTAEKKKKEFTEYLQKLEEKYLRKEISYAFYVETIYLNRNSRNIHEWIEYLDRYIKDCEKRIKKQKRIIIKNQVPIIFLSLFFIFILISTAPQIQDKFTGFAVKEQKQEFTQTLNLEFTEPTTYQWQVENPGILNSIKLSGEIEGDGIVKIYLEDNLILDSKELPKEIPLGIGYVLMIFLILILFYILKKYRKKIFQKIRYLKKKRLFFILLVFFIVCFFIFSFFHGNPVSNSLVGKITQKFDLNISVIDEQTSYSQTPSTPEEKTSQKITKSATEDLESKQNLENEKLPVKIPLATGYLLLAILLLIILYILLRKFKNKKKKFFIAVLIFLIISSIFIFFVYPDKNTNKIIGRVAEDNIDSPAEEAPEEQEEIEEEIIEEVTETEEISQENSAEESEELFEEAQEEVLEEVTEISAEQIEENTILEEAEENITEEILENVTEAEEPIEAQEEVPEEKEIPIKKFKNICEETCDLRELNLSKTSYILKIEITGNSKLTLDEIKYEIITFEEVLENVTEEIPVEIPEKPEEKEISVTTKQYKAIINRPVKWVKIVDVEKDKIDTLELPKEAKNISVKTGAEIQEALADVEKYEIAIENTDRKEIITGTITGQIILDEKIKKGFLIKISSWIKKFTITGKVIQEEELQEEITETADKKIIDVGKIAEQTQETEIAVEYYTEGPSTVEEKTSRGKKVIVSGPEELNYTDILAFAEIPEKFNVGEENRIKIFWKEENKYIDFDAYDLDSNGKLDYVEWIVPHLSNQTFEIILIVKAEHLDSNKDFISDIYEEVKELDGIWSEEIPNQHYVRITFEQNLTFDKDISLYPRIVNGNPKIEVYEVNGNELIAEFTNINSNQYNKIYLTNLISESQDVFDLKIIGGSLEFEYIIDPIEYSNFYTGSIDSLADGPMEWDHTVACVDDRILMVGVSIDSEGADKVSSVTYGGVPLSKIDSVASADDEESVDLWNLTNPECGAAQTISVAFTISTKEEAAGMSIIYADVESINLSSLNSSSSIGSTSSSLSVQSSSEENWVINAFALDVDAGIDIIVSGDSAVQRGYKDQGDTTIAIADGNDTDGEVTIGWSEFNDEWAQIGVELIPVEVVIDNEYPIFSDYAENPTDSPTYSFGADYEFNVTITSTNGTAWIRFDSTNYSATNISDNFNVTFSDLSAGIHYYNWSAYGNGSNKNLNMSATYDYTINKAVPEGSLTNDTALTRNYDEAITTIEYSENNNGDGDLNYIIYKNGVSVGGSDTEAGVGVYNYVLNTTGGTNYSSNSSMDNFTLTITQISSEVNLTLNNTWGNVTIAQGDTIDLNCSQISGDSGATLRLYREEILINEDASPIGNTTTFNTAQVENITCIYVNSQNYTTSSETWWVNVTAVSNNAPNTPSPEINSTDGSNTTIQDLNCFDIITDPDTGDKLNVSARWYNNSILHLTINYNNSYLNGTSFSATLDSANTTAGENWSCSLRLYDGTSYSDWENSSMNVTILNSAPQITHVFNESMTDVSSGPNEGPSVTSVIINFTAYDPDGVSDLNDNSAKINFTKTDEDIRQNLSCSKIGSPTGNYANYTCNITMWWWDGTGTWDIIAYIEDNQADSIMNTSTDFYVGERTAFVMGPSTLSWSGISPGATNQTSNNDPVVLNNTGNDDIGVDEIGINATNLLGETNPSFGLWAGNFSVAPFTGSSNEECNSSAKTMNASVYTNITGALVPAGNYTKNDGTGQEELYFCLRIIGSELTDQAYSTSNQGAWIIRILLVAVTYKRRKKKKKNISEDKLVQTMGLILDELKERYDLNKAETMNLLIREMRKKYKINKKEILELSEVKKISIPVSIFSEKMGSLESLIKYMRENLEMNYNEIAKEINRDQRTIWTSYKKATEKQKEPIKIKEGGMFIPTSTFDSKGLTILESVVVYLKQKGMKYNEIAELLNRDQRNIWTTYSRAIKKIKENLK